MSSAVHYIQKQLKEMLVNPPDGFRVEPDKDVYRWIVWLAGPADTPYVDGVYKAVVHFPKDFPFEPPEFRFVSTFWHPNVYNKGDDNGKVCISILHPPGEDSMNALETAMMRWTPVQTMNSVFISILSLLSEPDPKDSGAPANVDALVMYRNNRDEYNKKCKELAEKSVAELSDDFEPIKVNPPKGKEEVDDEDFYKSLKTRPALKGKERYKDELEQIRTTGMGSDLSDDQILDMLLEARGDISKVIEDLC